MLIKTLVVEFCFFKELTVGREDHESASNFDEDLAVREEGRKVDPIKEVIDEDLGGRVRKLEDPDVRLELFYLVDVEESG
jgi:hypothetical protein